MTREIPLTKGYVALVDDADFEWLSAFKWFAMEMKGGTYAARWNGARRGNEYMHRVITAAPAVLHVDHANRNRLDNRRENLRICERWQNAVNTPRPSRSGYRGIYQRAKGGRWGAVIRHQGRQTYIPGSHDTAESAARAYDEAAIQLHGEFALLNFPPLEPRSYDLFD